MLALMLALTAPPVIVERTADVVEWNHVYDDHGNYSFSQVIVWEWIAGDHYADAWSIPKRAPEVVKRGGLYRVTWQAKGTIYRVRSQVYRQTWTQHDREIADRKRRASCERANWGK